MFKNIEKLRLIGWFMEFDNMSVISWQSVLLVEEYGIPGDKHRPAVSHQQTSLHNVASSASRHQRYSNSQL
jgi:hypothetical protein